MSYREKINQLNRVGSAVIPFTHRGVQVGEVTEAYIESIAQYDCFIHSAEAVSFKHAHLGAEQYTALMAEVTADLHCQGIVDTWVGEAYAVNTDFEEVPYFLIERAAVSYFGMASYGVHINGLVKSDSGVKVWLARRARDKPFWPGALDQMVAGGQPYGISLMDNVIKECQEEADIPPLQAKKARQVSTIKYRCEGSRGVHNDCLFNYDLYLPEDFVPINTDGEVDSFELIGVEELAELTRDGSHFKDNCDLVNMDLLLRLGVINADNCDDYAWIKTNLYG